jgi:SAM-dependent methyltransferase
MYSQDEMLKLSPKPEGDIGKLAGIRMNERHLPLWEWGLSYITIKNDDIILDAGCGGGEAIKLLAKHSSKGMIYGIDYSKEMVRLSNETNKKLIDKNRVRIYETSISKLPFSDNTFNIVTAFETYTFWPDILNDFKEVRRVLQPGGIFLIVHSAYKHELFEERNNHWSELFKMKIHSLDEIDNILINSKFESIEMKEKVENNWLTIIAKKPFD